MIKLQVHYVSVWSTYYGKSKSEGLAFYILVQNVSYQHVNSMLRYKYSNFIPYQSYKFTFYLVCHSSVWCQPLNDFDAIIIWTRISLLYCIFISPNVWECTYVYLCKCLICYSCVTCYSPAYCWPAFTYQLTCSILLVWSWLSCKRKQY